MTQPDTYYLPPNSFWPIVGSVGLFAMAIGAGHWINGNGDLGVPVMLIGMAIIIIMMAGWFSMVAGESLKGRFNSQVDVSFRMGMMWFIFSEVMFFAAFFGTLFYAHLFSVPWWGGAGHGIWSHVFLWPNYTSTWPTNGPGNIGGDFKSMPAWGLPLINTLCLLTSGVTVTIAHHALKSGKRTRLLVFQALTIALGVLFLILQATEYHEAYTHFNMTLHSGIYGSTFFMLTGFHGLHVTLGAIMLSVIWFRCAFNHFTKDHHFAFEAVSWYWHFVDVVWLGLFLFVYVL